MPLPRFAHAAEPSAPSDAPAKVASADEDDPLDNNSAAESDRAAPREALEVVVTGTRTRENQARPPVRTDRVSSEEARRRGATNVGEALAGQLGVQVNPSAYGELGNPSAIQIQGFDGQRVLVLEDGERVIGDRGGAVDLSQFSMSGVSSIEVVAGPSSSLYGASAIGGVVNIISAPPELEGWSARLGAEGRSRWGLWSDGAVSVRKGREWASVSASFRRSGEVVLDGLAPNTALPELKQWTVAARAGAGISPDADVMVKVRYALERHDGLSAEIAPGIGQFLIDLPDTTHRVSVRAVETVRIGRSSSFQLSMGRQWFDSVGGRDRRASPIDDVRKRQHTQNSVEATVTALEGEVVTPIVGMRAEAEQFEQRLTRTELIGGAQQTRTTDEVSPTTLGSAALYAQLRWSPMPSLIVLPGVRAEAHNAFGAVVVPRLAASIAPNAWLLLRAAGGRGFRAPSAKELGFFFDHSALGYRVNGREDLMPETSWGLNGDVVVLPVRGLRASAGVFANWVDQLIDIELSEQRSGNSGVTDYEYVNVGRARTFGYQVDAQYRVTSRFRAEAGISYLWTRNDESQRPLSGRPPYTVVAGFQAPLPAQIDLYFRYRGVTDAFIEEGVRTPPFSTVDLRLSRPLWSRAEAYVGVLNALDAKKDATRFADQRPLEGRVLYVGIRAGFPVENDTVDAPSALTSTNTEGMP